MACPNYPTCKNTRPLEETKKVVAKCPKCGKDVVERKSKRGKVFYSCISYPECDYSAWNIPANEKCPSCGEELIVPHPYMHLRAFVLVPMLEVKADLVHPVFNKTISQMYDELENPEDVFLYGTVLPR